MKQTQVQPGSAAAYQVVRTISYVPDQNAVVDRSLYSYVAQFTDEAGTNALQGMYLLGLRLSMTGIPDARC